MCLELHFVKDATFLLDRQSYTHVFPSLLGLDGNPRQTYVQLQDQSCSHVKKFT